MRTHVSLRIDRPDIPRICTVAELLRVTQEVVVVVGLVGEMNDVLVAVGEPVLYRVRHTGLFGPDDPVADEPVALGSLPLDMSRDTDERLVEVGVADIQEDGSVRTKYSTPLVKTLHDRIDVRIRGRL